MKDINKKQAMEVFHLELGKFVKTLGRKGDLLTIPKIKKALKGISEDHPIHVSYRTFINKTNSRNFGGRYGIKDFERLSRHLKYIKGSYKVVVGFRNMKYDFGGKGSSPYHATFVKL